MHMAGWIAKLDDFLELGDHPLLVGAGRVQAKAAEQKVNAEYDAWHTGAINAPSAVERHFVEAISKTKAIEGARPKPVKERKGFPSFNSRRSTPAALNGNRHATAYFGIIRLAVGDGLALTPRGRHPEPGPDQGHGSLRGICPPPRALPPSGTQPQPALPCTARPPHAGLAGSEG